MYSYHSSTTQVQEFEERSNAEGQMIEMATNAVQKAMPSSISRRIGASLSNGFSGSKGKYQKIPNNESLPDTGNESDASIEPV